MANERITPEVPEYFSGANALVFISAPGRADSIELDIVTIDFTAADHKMPLYGYKSLYFDDVAKGSVVVQGNFTLNMQRAGELTHYLMDSAAKGSTFEEELETIDFSAPRFSTNLKENASLVHQAMIPAFRFDILLRYSSFFGPDEDAKVTGYSLSNVRVASMGMVTTPAGQPVGEQYTFLARNLGIL